MTEIQPRVFVVQETTHSLAGAEEYGKISFLLPRAASVTFANQPAVREIRRKLRDYDGATDHILPVGDPAAIGIAVSVAAQVSNGYVKILKWDNRAKRYFSIEVDLYDRLPVPETVS